MVKSKKDICTKFIIVPVIGSDGKPQSGMVGSETTQNVDDFRILERQKIAEDILNGNMNAKHITYDVFHKNYSINEWDYYDDFDKLKRLAKELTF